MDWSVENGRIGARGARVLTVEEESFAFMEHLHALRTEAGKSSYSLKHETEDMAEDMPENDDPDRMSMFRENERSGSLNADPITASLTLQRNADEAAVERATGNTLVPFAWACSVLNPDEMKQLAAMPANLTRSTLAGVYLADHFSGPHSA